MDFSAPSCVLGSGGLCAPHTGRGHDPGAFVEIGSLTKVLTGTLLMQLAAQGAVSVDDPVDRWLATPAGTGITLQQLQQHTSGLPRLPPPLPGTRRSDPYRPFTDQALRDLLAVGLGALVVAPPGEKEEYSNLGYAVLGSALSAAAGAPYMDLLAEHVLNPLGIRNEVTHQPPQGRSLVPTGIFGRRLRPWTMTGAILPAGGLWATPRAAARILTGLVVERVLGEPAPAWQRAGELVWHNGATRNASVFAGAFPDGRWILVHRLGGAPDATDRMGIQHLRGERCGGGTGAGAGAGAGVDTDTGRAGG
ncbi:beta-lactamase family protein [Streptomyces roseoverticillatus]|uniref:serine hydrolase domain-containing protein n=1 Tax=Streptomyces roseoverticillatus TaxID=66429 RepID=UPI001F421866|nr:serine hydrolase domain-containing protein [Streptomyces roseoverticillatus]MCF3103507.1 beta-lactamase family protein [Streptomyces roseoverticillatus]